MPSYFSRFSGPRGNPASWLSYLLPRYLQFLTDKSKDEAEYSIDKKQNSFEKEEKEEAKYASQFWWRNNSQKYKHINFPKKVVWKPTDKNIPLFTTGFKGNSSNVL